MEELDQAESWEHQPVMLEEVVEALRPGPGRVIFDGTAGLGGHSEALLERGARVIGWDRDPDAVRTARARLARFGDAFRAECGNFGDLAAFGPAALDGILLDLGMGSHQVNAPERGFSWRYDVNIDMRYDRQSGRPASALLREASEEEIAGWLRDYGEEPRARAVARAIVSWRRRADVLTTGGLAAAVESVCGSRHGRRHHPATRTFMAIRMVINDELGNLRRALEASASVLKESARLGIISFHSLEDRIVKQFMREASREFQDTPEWPNTVPNPNRHFRMVTRKALRPSERECADNHRARSARMRVAERLGPEGPGGKS